MARDHARIHLDLWGEDDWLDLSPRAQHLYFVLDTHPDLSFCGSGDWHPAKVAQRAKGWTVDGVEVAAKELVESPAMFLVLDLGTNEFLLRSWIKHDQLYRMPNMAVSMANARMKLASRHLRGVVVFEVAKLHAAEPELGSWKKAQVIQLLKQTAIDPAGEMVFNPQPIGSVNPSVKDEPNQNANPPPTPLLPNSLTPYSTPPSVGAELALVPPPEKKAKRRTQLSPSWTPRAEVWSRLEAERPDINWEAELIGFHASHKSKADVSASWDASWVTWYNSILSGKYAGARKAGSSPTAYEKKTAHNAEIFKALGEER